MVIKGLHELVAFRQWIEFPCKASETHMRDPRATGMLVCASTDVTFLACFYPSTWEVA